MNYKIENNQIKLENDFSIKLPLTVKKVLSHQKKIIALIDDGLGRPYGDHSLDQNIYAFSQDGKKIWQIEQAPNGSKQQSKPYTDMEIIDDSLIVYNWIGVHYSVDLCSGSVKPYGSGRPW